MIHNYYLYEQDGKLSMLPWDYNLAFGGFQGNDATSSVNDPIDDVLSDRPMQAWMFSSEAYTARYHEYYAEFLQTAYRRADRRDVSADCAVCGKGPDEILHGGGI